MACITYQFHLGYVYDIVSCFPRTDRSRLCGGVHNLTVYWHGQEFRKQNGTQEHLGVLFVKEVSDPKILTCGVW